MKLTGHRALALVLLISISLSCAAYFRVLFTEAGFSSIGRAWYYFREYSDFGFAPATLMGTLLSPFMSYPVGAPYMLAWQLQGAILLPAALLVIYSIIRHVYPASPAWAIALMGAISIVPHMAYNLGNLDNVLAILAIISVLSLRHTWVLVLTCIAGPLFHAMYVFAIYPCLLFLVYRLRGVSGHLAVVAIAMAVMFGISFLGMTRVVDEATYAALMAERAPELIRNGRFEFFASAKEFFAVTWGERRAFGFPYLWFTLALTHVAILVAFTVGKGESPSFVALRALAFGSPLLLVFFIADIYRLIAWVGFNVLLYAIYLAKFRGEDGLGTTMGARRSGLLLASVLPWMLLGPIGVTCFGDCGATAFPFFKHVIEAF